MIAHCFHVWAGLNYIKFISSVAALAGYFVHEIQKISLSGAAAAIQSNYALRNAEEVKIYTAPDKPVIKNLKVEFLHIVCKIVNSNIKIVIILKPQKIIFQVQELYVF